MEIKLSKRVRNSSNNMKLFTLVIKKKADFLMAGDNSTLSRQKEVSE